MRRRGGASLLLRSSASLLVLVPHPPGFCPPLTPANIFLFTPSQLFHIPKMVFLLTFPFNPPNALCCHSLFLKDRAMQLPPIPGCSLCPPLGPFGSSAYRGLLGPRLAGLGFFTSPHCSPTSHPLPNNHISIHISISKKKNQLQSQRLNLSKLGAFFNM